MKDIKARLIERIKRVSTIESFRFKPKEKVDFLPGQFLHVIFDEGNQNNSELNKYLSFSSSPTKDYIEVTKRLSESAFSQKLRSLKVSDEILLKGPLGNCVLKEEYKKIGFLIGGIGITPVISMIEYIAHKRLDTDVILFYSNRKEDDIAFKEELKYWQSTNKNIRIFFTVTDAEPKDTNCIYGRISRELLIEKAQDIQERIFFIFGPPKMVEAMKNICLGLNCKQENVKMEKFIGY
ncbi:MAG: FAD-dependent oxidoreductase [Candidatus Omnitrophica bacterium]|nr:FAD-dependent oxidoreductase [Candidatus Omnitrophota bacterium]